MNSALTTPSSTVPVPDFTLALSPTDDGEFGAVGLTMADGTRRDDCRVVTDGTYEIRCGSTRDPAAATELPLTDSAAAP